MPHNTEETRHAYNSKYNLNRKNQVILLMITDGKKWHFLPVKSLSALFRGIIMIIHDYCYVEMPEEDNKILKYNEGEKSMEVPFITYADLQSLLEKMNICHCHNNLEKSSTTKINKHIPSGYSLFPHCSFDTRKNKLDYYRGKNCMKNFCLHLREHATKITNYKKREMIPLTKEEKKMHRRKTTSIHARKDLVLMITIKTTIGLETIVIILENTEVLLTMYVI